MALKGFSREVLTEILNELAIKELATAKERWECSQVVERDTSLFRIGLKARLSNLNMFYDRRATYQSEIDKANDNNRNKAAFAASVRILDKLIRDTESSTREYQKQIFEKEHNIYNSHSVIEFPLDKRPELNALYDEFSATMLFFDDISTIGKNLGTLLESIKDDEYRLHKFIDEHVTDPVFASKLFAAKDGHERKELWVEKYGKDAIDVFEDMTDTEERINFVRDNVEFDHCLLGVTNNPNWGIGVYGKVDATLSKFEAGQQVLPCEYSDFEKITLADTLKIKNQDLMQMVQSRINIDRENLEVIDVKNIGGDEYRLVKLDDKISKDVEHKYLIRFICPSTGRVYHVNIIENMLSFSKLYEKGNLKTYIEAWWHITHAGTDPREVDYVIRT